MKYFKRVILLLLILTMGLVFTGCGMFETLLGTSESKPTSFKSPDELESGKAYVWHHEGAKIEDDLKKGADKNIFFTCISGDYNFKGNELMDASMYPRSIWIDSGKDSKIPTVTSNDRLIYVSKTEVPESIVFERFADYGYTIGISNMIQDSGGHYYFEYAVSDEEDYKYYIDTKSDASQLTELEVVTKVYLDKVGKIKVNEDSVSEGGTVLGLKKDKQYVCEFYTGTYYQDFLLTANIHSFGSMERFVSYNYEFMHSTFIVIEIPEYFKSGYYFVNGVGLFRYVADSDVGTYNGKAYDEAIDWNDPIIIYDENGEVIYDPSQPDYYKDKYSESDPGISDEELGLEPEPTIEEVD